MTLGDWRRVTKRYPCPVCGGNGWCAVSSNGDVCLCMRTESDWPAKQGMGGHLHRLSMEQHIPSPPTRMPSRPLLPTRKRSEISDWILDQLSLRRVHLEHLRGTQRQLSDAQIERRRYRSWPGYDDRRHLALIAWNTFGEAMCGFPGFYVDDDTEPSFVGPLGLLLPIRKFDGDIAAFQVRPDAADYGKRLWLSSSDRWFGTGSAAPAHMSRPASGAYASTLYVVEGVLNADICSDRLGAVCVGLSGMTNWRSVDWRGTIAELHVMTVIVALDRDTGRSRVEQERTLLRDECSRYADTRIATWDGELAKGFDDALNGGLPFVIQ